MANPFILSELLLYFVPPAVVYLIHHEFRDLLMYSKKWPLSMAIVLLPLWMVLIHAFSSLIFGYSLLSLSLFLSMYCLLVHLYFYIRTITSFDVKHYYLQAGQILFIALSAFLTSLVILRIYTYF